MVFTFGARCDIIYLTIGIGNDMRMIDNAFMMNHKKSQCIRGEK